MHEMMSVKTLETTAKAPAHAGSTRQDSFFSSIEQSTEA
jgi:hypothetical protein